jgi:hypothetical protein
LSIGQLLTISGGFALSDPQNCQNSRAVDNSNGQKQGGGSALDDKAHVLSFGT